MKLPRADVSFRAPGPITALFGLLAVVILTAACGSSTSTSSPSTTATSVASSPQSAALSKFTSCLESHGVPASAATSLFPGRFRGGAGGAGAGGGSVPSGSTPSGSTPSGSTPPGSFTPGSGGFTRTTIPSQYQSAFTQCRSDLPFGRGGGGFNSTAFKTYENCLEANGVTIPTTTTVAGSSGSTPGGFGGGGFGGGGLQALTSQPAYAAAAAKCASLRPSFGPTTTSVPAA